MAVYVSAKQTYKQNKQRLTRLTFTHLRYGYCSTDNSRTLRIKIERIFHHLAPRYSRRAMGRGKREVSVYDYPVC